LHLDCISIAYESVQARRANVAVPVAKRGGLHDYVPFYFCPRSPMLCAIHKGYVEGYQEGQQPLLHLVSTVDRMQAGRLDTVFTDGHAIKAISSFFEDLRLLDSKLDWNVIMSWKWADSQQDGDRKRRKQAEFQIHRFVPWHLIEEVGVIDEATRGRVEQLLDGQSHRPPVRVHRDWYY
jgi:hypothetical protein